MTMLALSVYTGDTPVIMRNLANTYNVLYNIGLDTNSSFQNQYTVEGTPKMFFFDSNGVLLKSWYGYTSFPTLANDINKLLGITTMYNTTIPMYTDVTIQPPWLGIPPIVMGPIIAASILLLLGITKKSCSSD